ncbi:MAG: hypothetical protein ACK55L_01430 [bacterium]
MKLGAEPKKIAVLVGILGVGLAVMYLGDGGPPGGGTPGPKARPAVSPPGSSSVARPVPARKGKAEAEAAATMRPVLRAAVQEFKPVLKAARAADRIAPATIDPTLRLELIRRLGGVRIEGGARTIFDFGTAPPPKQPDPPKIFPKPAGAAAVAAAPPPPVSITPAAPVKPAAPPIPLKFYGFVGGARAKAKRAFFLDGEEIYVAGEGEVIQKRYRVVRIGLNSVVVEDQQFESEQTLSLEQAESLD